MNKDFLVKYEGYEPNPELGKFPHERSLEENLKKGIVVIDKPRGLSSQQVSAYVKDMLRIEKAGHVGTLDPNVTGVLPILLNKGTRLMSYLSSSVKEYVVLMHLHKEANKMQVLKALKHFEGEIEQLPPVKSAVKRRKRKRTIYKNEFIEMSEDKRYVLFRSKVQAGTYIRVLCKDIGEHLGIGAHMQELRRTLSAGFDEDFAVNMYDFHEAAYLYVHYGREDLLKNYVLPIEVAVKHLKKIYITDAAASAIAYGAQLFAKGVVLVQKGIEKGEIIALMSMKNELVAIAQASHSTDEIMRMRKGVVAKPKTVMFEKDYYPKMW